MGIKAGITPRVGLVGDTHPQGVLFPLFTHLSPHVGGLVLRGLGDAVYRGLQGAWPLGAAQGWVGLVAFCTP